MIVGIGVDVVDISRFEVTLQRTPQMRARLFTSAEQALNLQSLAARFAAKEALAKALGAPSGLVWTDAEVVVAESGAPELLISGTVQAAAQLRGVRRWHLSLAHDGGIATAIVLAEG